MGKMNEDIRERLLIIAEDFFDGLELGEKIKYDDIILIEDYIGRTYDFDNVTNSGEVFDSMQGWVQQFFLEEDLAVITVISEKYRGFTN
jgi:hypothetical protein